MKKKTVIRNNPSVDPRKKVIARGLVVFFVTLMLIWIGSAVWHNKHDSKVLDSYANSSKPTLLKPKMLKNQPKTYQSDIDGVKMVNPGELEQLRAKALGMGYQHNYAGYLSIPFIGLFLPILNGVNMYTLSLGAAAYNPDSVQIGGHGNYVLAGHNMNTSQNVLFSRIPTLNPAQNQHLQVILTNKVKNYYYTLKSRTLVKPYQPVYKGTETPTKDSVLFSDTSKRQITLYTCNSNGTRRWVLKGDFDYETKH